MSFFNLDAAEAARDRREQAAMDAQEVSSEQQAQAEQAVFEWACENNEDVIWEAYVEGPSRTDHAALRHALSIGDTAAFGELMANRVRAYVIACERDRVEDML